MQNMDPYDQYEVSVPLSIAGDCLQMVSHNSLTHAFPPNIESDFCCKLVYLH